MKEFTQKHQRVLDYIRQCVDDGVPPTVREICDSLGIKSTSTGHKYLRELEEMGYITMGGNRNRCIRLVGRQEEKAVQVPLLGTVAAGMPILAVESLEGYVPFAAARYDPAELFALRVRGESMIEAGILDGDVIIARRTPVTVVPRRLPPARARSENADARCGSWRRCASPAVDCADRPRPTP